MRGARGARGRAWRGGWIGTLPGAVDTRAHGGDCRDALAAAFLIEAGALRACKRDSRAAGASACCALHLRQAACARPAARHAATPPPLVRARVRRLLRTGDVQMLAAFCQAAMHPSGEPGWLAQSAANRAAAVGPGCATMALGPCRTWRLLLARFRRSLRRLATRKQPVRYRRELLAVHSTESSSAFLCLWVGLSVNSTCLR